MLQLEARYERQLAQFQLKAQARQDIKREVMQHARRVEQHTHQHGQQVEWECRSGQAAYGG